MHRNIYVCIYLCVGKHFEAGKSAGTLVMSFGFATASLSLTATFSSLCVDNGHLSLLFSTDCKLKQPPMRCFAWTIEHGSRRDMDYPNNFNKLLLLLLRPLAPSFLFNIISSIHHLQSYRPLPTITSIPPLSSLCSSMM